MIHIDPVLKPDGCYVSLQLAYTMVSSVIPSLILDLTKVHNKDAGSQWFRLRHTQKCSRSCVHSDYIVSINPYATPNSLSKVEVLSCLRCGERSGMRPYSPEYRRMCPGGVDHITIVREALPLFH